MLKILEHSIYCECGGELYSELEGDNCVSVRCKICNCEHNLKNEPKLIIKKNGSKIIRYVVKTKWNLY